MLNEIKFRQAVKKTKILYWIFTSLFACMMLGSAIPDIFSMQMAIEGFSRMDMPVYLLPFLGVAKTLGVIALFIPGYPRLKEWAYAGLVFDLAGATYSLAASGQTVADYAFMVLPIVLAAGSYTLYHKLRKVPSPISGQKINKATLSQNTNAVSIEEAIA